MEKLQIGDMIRVLRRNKEITQEQLAETLNVSTPAICKWESGQTNPDISMLPVIASYFQVSIDFLLGYSTELKPERIKNICDDITQKFIDLPFVEAQKAWLDCLKQFPACFPLRYELANVAVFQLAKAGTEKDMVAFVLKIIEVFEQCAKCDVLKIKQGSYLQMANLFMGLQDFDKAQSALNQIPVQLVNPQILLSMIYVQKKDYKRAITNIQENLFRSINDIFGELGNMASVFHFTESGNVDLILDIYEKQKKIINAFGLEPLYGVSVGLLIAITLAQKNEQEKVINELEDIAKILEKKPQGTVTINKIPFFETLEPSIQEKSANNFSVEACRMLLEKVFELLRKDTEIAMLKSRIEKMLN